MGNKKKYIKLDPDKLDKVIHKFKGSLAKIVKEFSDEIMEIYDCVIQNNGNNN